MRKKEEVWLIKIYEKKGERIMVLNFKQNKLSLYLVMRIIRLLCGTAVVL